MQISSFGMQHLNTSSSNSTVSWNADQVGPSVVLGLCCLVGVPGNIAVIMQIVRTYRSDNFTLKLILNLAVSDLLSLIIFQATMQISSFGMQHLNTSSSNSTISWNADQVGPSVVLGLCCLVGVPGNIAVIMQIVRTYRSDNFTLKLILNLAVSDLLSLIILPVWIYTWLYGWVFQPLACTFIAYFLYCNICSNLLTVTLMSVHRYLAVLYPQSWARLHGMGERVLLVTLWGLSGVLASPMIVVRDVVVHKDKGQYSCVRKYRSDGEKVAILFFETLLGFVVPFSILVTSYFCLHKKVNQTAFFSSQRMTRLVSSIVVAFFIFWSPVHVMNVLNISSTLLKSKSLLKFSQAAWDLTGALTFINSSMDPFLYAFSSRKIKLPSHQKTQQMPPPGMSKTPGHLPNISTAE